MRTIKLYGDMGKRFGREFELDVKTPAEAIRALCSQIDGFRAYLHAHAQDAFKVFVGGRNACDELKFPSSDREVICIAPVVQGAGAAARIVLGVVMLAVAYFVPWTAPYLVPMGISMILGGVVQLLSPTSKTDTTAATTNAPSYNFNGAVNTTAQGHPVPLAYGRVIAGSAVISAGMTTV